MPKKVSISDWKQESIKISYPAAHVKSSPQDSIGNGNILPKLFYILYSSIRKHCPPTRENKVFAFSFHPSLMAFPISNLIVWHIWVPNLQNRNNHHYYQVTYNTRHVDWTQWSIHASITATSLHIWLPNPLTTPDINLLNLISKSLHPLYLSL